MLHRPEISVIMPVKNGAATVKRAVRSVLAQSVSGIELIAVDDGSDDDTPEILDREADRDERVRVIHQANAGVSAARNAGINAASGTYTAFADSDDVTGSDWLMSLLTGIKEREGCTMSVAGYRTETGGRITGSREFEPADLTPEETMRRCLRYRDLTTAVWNKLFVTDILNEKQIRFRENYRIGEDMVFIAEYVTQGGLVRVVPGCGYVYNDSGAGAMGSFSRERVFRQSWVSEWDAIKKTEEILCANGMKLRETDIKKVRIAGKLLPLMAACRAKDPGLMKELQHELRSRMDLVLREPEFDRNRRAFMMLGALSPMLSGVVRRTAWKKQG